MRSSSVNHLILKSLQQDQAHLTAQQVYERIRSSLPAVNPSTVYRALERLAHAGLVSVSDMGQGAAVYESVGEEHHHHLVCQDCGAVIQIEDAFFKKLFDQIQVEYNFQLVTNHLILFGRCPACQENASGRGL